MLFSSSLVLTFLLFILTIYTHANLILFDDLIHIAYACVTPSYIHNMRLHNLRSVFISCDTIRTVQFSSSISSRILAELFCLNPASPTPIDINATFISLIKLFICNSPNFHFYIANTLHDMVHQCCNRHPYVVCVTSHQDITYNYTHKVY